jgi:hypothetical protein
MRVGLAVGVAAAAVLAVARPASAGADEIDGTWRLVETRQVMADGSVRPDPDLGPRPLGYMMYDADAGRVCTTFSDTTRSRWAAATPSEAELRTMYAQTVIYCGRYRVDDARRAIVFDLDITMSPNNVGTTRERRFERSGDTLTLYPTPLPAGVTAWSIRLERVRR